MKKVLSMLGLLCIYNIVYAGYGSGDIDSTKLSLSSATATYTNIETFKSSMSAIVTINNNQDTSLDNIAIATGTINTNFLNYKSEVQADTTTINTKITTLSNNVGSSTQTLRTDLTTTQIATGTINTNLQDYKTDVSVSTNTLLTKSSATVTYTHLEVFRSSMSSIVSQFADVRIATENINTEIQTLKTEVITTTNNINTALNNLNTEVRVTTGNIYTQMLTSFTNVQNGFVKIVGDTMTGNLTINNSSVTIIGTNSGLRTNGFVIVESSITSNYSRTLGDYFLNGTGSLRWDNDTFLYGAADSLMQLKIANAIAWYCDNSLRMGVNTVPSSKFDVLDGSITCRGTGVGLRIGSLFQVGTNGNVGINTLTPAQKLEVNGAIKSSYLIIDSFDSIKRTNSQNYFSIFASTDFTEGAYFKMNADKGATDYSYQFNFNNIELMRIKPNGNIGINTSFPITKLDITSGSISINRAVGDLTSVVLWLNQNNAAGGGNYGLVAQNTGSFTVFDNDAGIDRLIISSIGAISALGVYNNDVSVTNRDVYVDNTGLIGYVASSKRYKENITDIKDIDWIFKLNPVNFTYKKDITKSKQYGLIAEDVEKINKNLVTYNDKNEVETVEYSRLIPILLKAIQKQQKEIDKLKRTHLQNR